MGSDYLPYEVNRRRSDRRKNVNLGRNTLRNSIVAFGFFVFFGLTMLWLSTYHAESLLTWNISLYGAVMLSYMLTKMILSFGYRPATWEPFDYKVSVVIPTYNESAAAVIDTLESVVNQNYPLHEVFLVDDGSINNEGYDAALHYKSKHEETSKNSVRIHVHKLPQNQGKRIAQAYAFERATGDVIVTVDSDTYLFSDAIRQLLVPLSEPEVMAVTGHVVAKNKNENLLTRLIDMRYENAFRVERAAQSVTGNVLVCSGPLSCYRCEVIFDNLRHYKNQKFLGKPVQFGDDRCLTNYAIRKGKTIYQATARCLTDVPNTLSKFLRQQLRWNKSFFRESIIALGIGFRKPVVMLWVMLELVLWLFFGFAFAFAILSRSSFIGPVLLLYYFYHICLSAYARNVFYIIKSPVVFFLAPIYGIIHLLILFPLRFYALATLRVTKWGTR